MTIENVESVCRLRMMDVHCPGILIIYSSCSRSRLEDLVYGLYIKQLIFTAINGVALAWSHVD